MAGGREGASRRPNLQEDPIDAAHRPGPEAYLESIDWYRGIRTRLEPLDEKKRWLGRVAFEMQRQRTKMWPQEDEILASSDQVCRWIAAAMSESGQEPSRGTIRMRTVWPCCWHT